MPEDDSPWRREAWQGTPARETEGPAATWRVRAADMITAYSKGAAGTVLLLHWLLDLRVPASP